MPFEHASDSFAWKADASFLALDLDADLSRAYQEVRAGKGVVMIRGLPVDGALEAFVDAVDEVGSHFGHKLSQNAQGELIGHVIDATQEDPTPRMYRSNLELRPHSDITAMIALACWQQARSGGASVVVSGVTVHDAMRKHAPQLLEPLYHGFHYHRLGEQAPDEEPATSYRVPVFCVRQKQLSCRYQRAGIVAGHRERGVPLSAEDIAAFNLFDDIARAPENRVSFHLERGDMMVINNYAVMHARTQFTNHAQPGRQRRLVRLWLDAPGFRDVPAEFNLFKANGVPPQSGRRATYDFRKLYADDPVATGGIPRIDA
ncbi:MAG: TauD/TfdA family dioxygenase [Burkholderiales bacterium]